MSEESWRVFRLLLVDLSERDLARVEQDAAREPSGRLERDQGIVRLFFSALDHVELDIARSVIKLEVQARARDAEFLRQLAAGSGRESAA